MGMELYMTKGKESVFIMSWDEPYNKPIPNNDNLDDLIINYEDECRFDETRFLMGIINLAVSKIDKQEDNITFSDEWGTFKESYDNDYNVLCMLRYMKNLIDLGWKVEVSV